MTLNLKGENLDTRASIKVDEKTLRGDMFWINPKSGEPDPQTGFCTELNVSFNDAGPYLEGGHTFTLVNKDGQAATAAFPIDPMSIDKVTVVRNADNTATLTVTGNHFVTGTTARWRNDKGEERALSAPAVTEKGNELTITGVPGDAGMFTLVLQSPMKLRATRSVTIPKAGG